MPRCAARRQPWRRVGTARHRANRITFAPSNPTHTLGLDAATVQQLDGFRKKRNVSAYDRIGTVSDQEADEVAALAKRLRADVEQWLRARHPHLL